MASHPVYVFKKYINQMRCHPVYISKSIVNRKASHPVYIFKNYINQMRCHPVYILFGNINWAHLVYIIFEKHISDEVSSDFIFPNKM